MRIALDARLAHRGLGIATYVGELSRALAAQDAVEQVVWLGAPSTAPRHRKVVVVDPGRPYPALEHARGRRLASTLDVDVIHFAANTGWGRPGPIPMVVTVHDAISTRTSGASLRQRVGRAYMRHQVPQAIRSADAVVAVSAAAADDIASAGWLGPIRPTVIHHGVRPRARPLPFEERRHFACFAGTDPRKNVELALAAFAQFEKQAPFDVELQILAGAGIAASDRRLANSTRGARVVGYLPVEELHRILASSIALLHTSRAEGFGLPVLEAMSVGTPVIGGFNLASNEIAGDALLRVDARNPAASIADRMLDLATSAERFLDSSRRGLDRASSFSWDVAAGRHLEVYYRAIDAFRRA